MSVRRIVFGFVVVPDPHVGVGDEVDLFNIIADDPSGEVPDGLLVIAGNCIVA